MSKLTKIAAGVLIGLAVLLGLFALTLSRRTAPPPSAALAQASFPVVVTTKVLPAGKAITVDALRVQSLPINPNGAFTDPSLLVGRVPIADIGAESPVLEAQLSAGLAERIEPGERAIAVHVEEANAVGNRLRPGNFVDVFFTLKREAAIGAGSEIERSQARLLMSRVRVLAFGNATGGNTGGNDAPGDPNGMVHTAVLAVPVGDVDRLTLAETSGRLVFALRNPRDTDVVDVNAFPALPGVLKTAAHTGAVTATNATNAMGASTQDSTRAAAGVALDDLSGSTSNGNAKAANAAARPFAAPRAVASAARTAANGNGDSGIEVIRGGRAETVAR